jgi:signal transduction histidine kinase
LVQHRQPPEEAAGLSGPIAVLIVEDDEGDARLIEEAFSEFGLGAVRSERAETIAAALRFPPGAFDAVLLDMNLPDSQGLDNVAAISRHFTDAAIAVLTGRNEASLAAAVVRSGAQDYVVKGELSGPDLVAAVRRSIELKRRAEIERLRHRDKLQRELIANVSHEFRTPLAAIRGALDTLERGDLDDKARAEFLAIIARHSARLERLVDDVMLVSSMDAAAAAPSPRPVALRRAVEDCLADLAALAKKGGLRLEADVPAGLRVKADPEQLARVLTALCGNAVEYNRRGGSVRVTATREGGEVVVAVRDTGMGIPKEDLPVLFDRFHRSDAARGRESSGTGLGLMIVKRLVTAQGGRVWAESREGEGSTFRFSLPPA